MLVVAGRPPRDGSVTERARRETWRRALHVASGSLGPLAVAVGPAVATPGFAVLVVLAAVTETARITSSRSSEAVNRFAGGLFRPAETGAVSGAATLALGYALTWWLFPAAVAERAIVVAAIADPVAATVGSRAGGGKAKSWIGSLACACAAALVLLLSHVAPAAVAAAAVGAALAERAPWRGSDNITVPLVVAAVLRWMP
jgi:dolichol kinase